MTVCNRHLWPAGEGILDTHFHSAVWERSENHTLTHITACHSFSHNLSSRAHLLLWRQLHRLRVNMCFTGGLCRLLPWLNSHARFTALLMGMGGLKASGWAIWNSRFPFLIPFSRRHVKLYFSTWTLPLCRITSSNFSCCQKGASLWQTFKHLRKEHTL